MEDDEKLVPRDYVVESIKAEIELSSPARRQQIFEAIALAALGSIPWVGGVIAAASAAAGKYRDGEAAVEGGTTSGMVAATSRKAATLAGDA